MNQIDNIMLLATAYADERVMAVRGRSTKEDVVAADQALRAAVEKALAVQPKQEPVAYITRNEEGDPSMLFFDHLEAESYCAEDEDPEPLYATPQPHRKAMQQALGCLEDIFGKNKVDVLAINALREVLGEVE